MWFYYSGAVRLRDPTTIAIEKGVFNSVPAGPCHTKHGHKGASGLDWRRRD